MPDPVRISVPDAQVTWNTLYRTSDPRYLTQDLLLVELWNGMFIDVSWFPEHDPQGAYHITLCQDNWESQLLAWETKSLTDLVLLVQRIVQNYSLPSVSYSCSTGTYEVYAVPA